MPGAPSSDALVTSSYVRDVAGTSLNLDYTLGYERCETV